MKRVICILLLLVFFSHTAQPVMTNEDWAVSTLLIFIGGSMMQYGASPTYCWYGPLNLEYTEDYDKTLCGSIWFSTGKGTVTNNSGYDIGGAKFSIKFYDILRNILSEKIVTYSMIEDGETKRWHADPLYSWVEPDWGDIEIIDYYTYGKADTVKTISSIIGIAIVAITVYFTIEVIKDERINSDDVHVKNTEDNPTMITLSADDEMISLTAVKTFYWR